MQISLVVGNCIRLALLQVFLVQKAGEKVNNFNKNSGEESKKTVRRIERLG